MVLMIAFSVPSAAYFPHPSDQTLAQRANPTKSIQFTVTVADASEYHVVQAVPTGRAAVAKSG